MYSRACWLVVNPSRRSAMSLPCFGPCIGPSIDDLSLFRVHSRLTALPCSGELGMRKLDCRDGEVAAERSSLGQTLIDRCRDQLPIVAGDNVIGTVLAKTPVYAPAPE